jgi:hypothetical protein
LEFDSSGYYERLVIRVEIFDNKLYTNFKLDEVDKCELTKDEGIRKTYEFRSLIFLKKI